MSPSKDGTRYYNVKVSEEAQVAAKVIQSHYQPDMEMQELYSLAVMEYLRAYYPNLEGDVAIILERRQEARRGEQEAPQP